MRNVKFGKKIQEANKKGEKINFAKLFGKPGNLSIKNYYSDIPA